MPRFTSDQYKSAILKLNIASRENYSSKDRAFFYCALHHGDKTPSLSINFKLGVYHCFGCGESGTIPHLVRTLTNRSMEDFLNLKNEDLTKMVLKKDEEPVRKTIQPDRAIDIRGIMVPWNVSKEATAYLNKRYITSNIATRMNMKYIEEAYVNGTYFKKRLCIPIYNENGFIVNLEGRDTTFQQQQKCLYPALAKKIIYEWYKLDKEKPLYLFEGLIKMAVARSDKFFNNSSTVFGNMISQRQLLILNMFKEIRLIPDNDKGGLVLIRFLSKSLTTKLSIYEIVDHDIKDADEIPEKTGKSIEQFRLDGGFHLQQTLR
jgi:hypothetical protein